LTGRVARLGAPWLAFGEVSMGRTTISWTAVQSALGRWYEGFTFNPWQGCTKVSAGCKNCYAEQIDARFWGGTHWGQAALRGEQSEAYWSQPHDWNRRALKLGVRLRVFCGSVCDWLEDRPDLVKPRARLLELIASTPALDWLLLSKRPENILRLTPWRAMAPANVWLGISAENQEQLELRLPLVQQLGAVVHFVSAEPLLGPLSSRAHRVDWLIVGSERGPSARPPNDVWLDGIVAECRQMGVPLFLKQWQLPGARPGFVEDMPAWRGRQWLEQPAAAGWQPRRGSVHLCHARRCEVPVPPKLLMCGKHWRMVPRPLQAAVWKHYRTGQEADKSPSPEYLKAALAAINAVAQREAELAGAQLALPLGGP
jgi:protein gp37